MIKIKSDFSNGATAVPTDLIDKYLKLAPSASFKVLLFILRNPNGVLDEQQISLCTGLSLEDVKDCIDFWEAEDEIGALRSKIRWLTFALVIAIIGFVISVAVIFLLLHWQGSLDFWPVF